ncbi:MAG: RDD family protein [Mucilaginibacter sp.]|nr:RDD family protein [Mucilaginibacter sp.]
MNTVTITTAQNIDIEYELGGLGERIVARIIDYAIFLLVLFFTIFAVGGIGFSDATVGVATIIYGVLFVFYDLICELSMNGQSIGKKVMKIRVISADGARPRLGQYLLRWLMRIVDFTIGGGVIALVAAALSEKGQRLGDMTANTVLVRTTPRTDSTKIAFKPSDVNYKPVFTEASQLTDNDVELINEVITTYVKTKNSVIVYNMANKLKMHLNVQPPQDMNDMQFLQTLLRDYTHLISDADLDFKKPVKSYEPVYSQAAQLTDTDLALINEVISTYNKTENAVIVYNMAAKIKENLNLKSTDGMNDMEFLQALLCDHKQLTSQPVGS